MESVWFIAKSLVVTIIVIMAMQIQVGTSTIEKHINQAARTSGVIDIAQDMADGISRIARTGWKSLVGGVNSTFGVDKRTTDSSPISFERSRAYIEQKAEQSTTD